jgi:hypothetical protein
MLEYNYKSIEYIKKCNFLTFFKKQKYTIKYLYFFSVGKRKLFKEIILLIIATRDLKEKKKKN